MRGRTGIADRAAFNLGALAGIACGASRRTEAEDLLRQALSCGFTRAETVSEVRNMAGRITLRLGWTASAVEHHHQALDAARPTNTSRSGPKPCSAWLASVHVSEARLLGCQAKELIEPAGYLILTAQALTTQCEIELADGNGQRAVTYLERALRLHRATGHKPGETRTLQCCIARDRSDMGDMGQVSVRRAAVVVISGVVPRWRPTVEIEGD